MQVCDFNKVALHFDILTLRVLHLHAFDTFLGRCKTFLVSDMTRIVWTQTNYSGEKNSNGLFYFFYYLPIFIY